MSGKSKKKMKTLVTLTLWELFEDSCARFELICKPPNRVDYVLGLLDL